MSVRAETSPADVLLASLPDTAAGPEARYETHEAISLAFVTALQLLPPRQRAALILRDVLLVITLRGDRVSVITRFDNAVLPRFGLPRTLTD